MEKNNLLGIGTDRIQDLFTSIAKSITSSLELSKVTEAIMQQVESFFQPNNWSVLIIDETTQELFFFIAKGINIQLAQNFRLDKGEGMAGHVARTGQSIIIYDAQQDPRFSKKIDEALGYKTHSLIAVPIKFQEKVLGVIEIINVANQRNFTDQELSILETIADFSAIALTNAKAHEDMTWNSTHDALTSVYNRVRLDKLMKKCDAMLYSKQDKRETDALYLIVIWVDIDNFKIVNDTHGHHVGDKILIKTAQILQSYCRENDFTFRVGGDEFLLVIMDLRQEDVQLILNRIERKIQKDSRDHVTKSGFSYGITYGLKVDFQQLIKTADNNMYVNKAKNKEDSKEDK